MPLTKTAKRALRSSKRKKVVNDILRTKFKIALRMAKKQKSAKSIREAISVVDRAVKRNIIHKNKAARIKSQLSKLLPKQKAPKKKK